MSDENAVLRVWIATGTVILVVLAVAFFVAKHEQSRQESLQRTCLDQGGKVLSGYRGSYVGCYTPKPTP